MKNKLKIFLCVVMILVFSFGTCATAYAYTGYPTSIDKALTTVKSYYKDELAGYVPVFFYTTDSKGPALMFLPDSYSSDTISVSSYGDNGNSIDFRVNDKNLYVFTFDKSNCYSKPSVWKASNVWMSVPYGLNKDNISNRIIQSYKTILAVDGKTVLFQQGTTQSPNPTNPDSTTHGSNTLSNILNKNSTMLSGVLQEIVTLLPILVPVLVTFLAIRKGIRFTLQTLRSA